MIRILIIIVVAIALLIGGVFGVATFAPNLLPNMVLELLGIEPPKEKTTAQPVRPGPLETILVDLEPMEIPLFRDNKVDRKLFMHILIEVRRGKDEKIINENLVRIIDSFLTYVHALNALNIKPGVSDRAFLKERLLVKAEEIIGPDIIIDLLFVNIFERPFN
tara:strand:+ start:2465 stop:2953 length:489 start_codon:yes stop_codon:yes gene_type:complete